MQKTKTIPIGNRSFTVRELSVRTIWDLVNNSGDETVSGIDRMKDLLKLGCPDLTEETLLEMYPSEIEELWQAFEEVNASFLGVCRQMGIDRVIMAAIKESISEAARRSPMRSASSSEPDTVQ